MQLQHPLRVVTPTLDGDVLAVLAGVEAGFTTGQIRQLLQENSVAGIRKVLGRLVAQGVVDAELVGRAFQYRLNREHLASVPIIALSQQRDTLLKRLEDQLATWSPRPVYAAIFGSAARGDMRVDSDIDLFIVQPSGDDDGDRWEEQTGWLAGMVSRWTGNDARVLGMTEAEVRVGADSADPILSSIAAEGLTLVGKPTWLRQQLHQASTARR